MFSRYHIAAIAFTIISVYGLNRYIHQGGLDRARRWLIAIALLAPLFDPIYWLWEWQRFGRLSLNSTLPLYLCSLFWLLLPSAVFLRPGRWRQIALACLASVVMVAVTLGFVLNTYLEYYPFFSFIPLRSLIYHYLAILGTSLLWTSGYYQVAPGDQWRAFIPVVILLIPALLLNVYFGYDYGYTAGGLGTPIEILSRALPKPLYLIVLYGGWFLINWGLFYRRVPLRPKKDRSV